MLLYNSRYGRTTRVFHCWLVCKLLYFWFKSAFDRFQIGVQVEMVSLFSSERHVSSNSSTRDSPHIHPTRVLQHRQSNDSLVLGRRTEHFVLMSVFLLAHKKVFLIWSWEMDSWSILHCFIPIYLQVRISVLPPGLIFMHMRMRGPKNSHLFLAASSVSKWWSTSGCTYHCGW